MQDYVTAFPLAMLALAHVACIAAGAAIVRTPLPNQPGWITSAPSGTHWFAYIAAWLLGVLISWVWIFVGSARHDAAFQMNVALVLAIVFTAAAAWAGFMIAAMKRMALRWRGDTILWRTKSREMRQSFDQFDAIKQGWDSAYHIRFKDGVVLKVDIYARRTDDFLMRFSEALDRDIF